MYPVLAVPTIWVPRIFKASWLVIERGTQIDNQATRDGERRRATGDR